MNTATNSILEASIKEGEQRVKTRSGGFVGLMFIEDVRALIAQLIPEGNYVLPRDDLVALRQHYEQLARNFQLSGSEKYQELFAAEAARIESILSPKPGPAAEPKHCGKPFNKHPSFNNACANKLPDGTLCMQWDEAHKYPNCSTCLDKEEATFQREHSEAIAALSTGPAPKAVGGGWIKTSERLPDDGIEVIGFHEDWVDEDFNPNGTRVCFQNDGERWQSARWYDSQDTYINGEERVFGDKTDGSLAPSHWMPMPSSPVPTGGMKP
jgi:hypothetical protein